MWGTRVGAIHSVVHLICWTKKKTPYKKHGAQVFLVLFWLRSRSWNAMREHPRLFLRYWLIECIALPCFISHAFCCLTSASCKSWLSFSKSSQTQQCPTLLWDVVGYRCPETHTDASHYLLSCECDFIFSTYAAYLSPCICSCSALLTARPSCCVKPDKPALPDKGRGPYLRPVFGSLSCCLINNGDRGLWFRRLWSCFAPRMMFCALLCACRGCRSMPNPCHLRGESDAPVTHVGHEGALRPCEWWDSGLAGQVQGAAVWRVCDTCLTPLFSVRFPFLWRRLSVEHSWTQPASLSPSSTWSRAWRPFPGVLVAAFLSYLRFHFTHLPHKAVAEVSNHNEPIGSKNHWILHAVALGFNWFEELTNELTS